MKRFLAISQRVDVVASHGERRDALDQRWAQVAHELGLLLLPLSNRAGMTRDVLAATKPAGLVLSGGNDLPSGDKPGTAPERDAAEREMLAWAEATGTPVLGICRGLQMLNLHCGGSLQPVTGHVACRHALKAKSRSSMIQVPDDVNSYHNFGFSPAALAPDLAAVALAADGTVEAVQHRRLPWFGIMWHPEREHPFRAGDLATMRAILGLAP